MRKINGCTKTHKSNAKRAQARCLKIRIAVTMSPFCHLIIDAHDIVNAYSKFSHKS